MAVGCKGNNPSSSDDAVPWFVVLTFVTFRFNANVSSVAEEWIRAFGWNCWNRGSIVATDATMIPRFSSSLNTKYQHGYLSSWIESTTCLHGEHDVDCIRVYRSSLVSSEIRGGLAKYPRVTSSLKLR